MKEFWNNFYFKYDAGNKQIFYSFFKNGINNSSEKECLEQLCQKNIFLESLFI